MAIVQLISANYMGQHLFLQEVRVHAPACRCPYLWPWTLPPPCGCWAGAGRGGQGRATLPPLAPAAHVTHCPWPGPRRHPR